MILLCFVILGQDMENGEVWSSKSSSTEASSPMIRSETWAAVESLTQSQQGKSKIVAREESVGEKVNIEKENSHSSVESDVRNSNFLSMQGTYSPSNGIQSERFTDYDDSSLEIEGGNQNNGSSTDLDPLSESIFNLESVKKALEIEVLKFREIRQDVLVNNPVLDLPAEFTNDDQNAQETSSEPSQSGDSVHRFSFTPQSEVLETENRDVETEIEDLFMQKIKAEVEYLAISRAVQNLSVANGDKITILEEQKTRASKQTQILNKLGDTEKKAMMLHKEAEKLEKFCEDIASADETLKLQNRVCKYITCLFMQLVSLALVLGIFMFQLSPKYVDNIPT